ncbi:MAG: hypothetical protein CXZ00_04800 [Acidobacteria bacterium]|nr:MAG: hypothetical protein CXZ00_04800 [Acidobacteriota bacterium]
MKHVTDEQLAGWLAGEADSETQEHVQRCEQCHAEATAVRRGISRYALAVRRESAYAHRACMAKEIAPRKLLALHRLRWFAAGVLALLLAAQTAWMMKPRSGATTSQSATSVEVNLGPAIQMSDDELLNAVHNDLNRVVPQALAPVSVITIARNDIAAASTGAISQ